MTIYFTIVDKVVELEQAGKTLEAVSLIEESLRDPSLSDDPQSLSLLAQRAAIMCRYEGDFKRECNFSEAAMKLSGDDPGPLYALADVYLRLGEKEKARAYFNKCRDLCLSRSEGKREKSYLKLLERRREFWE